MIEHSTLLEPITWENSAVVLGDHQVGLLSGVRDIPLGELKHNVATLARAATVLGIPLVVTTTAADSMWGPTAPELIQALLTGQKVIDRSTVNARHDLRVREAIEVTGRQKLIFAGVPFEVCAALPAISATAAGHDAYVAVDASGTFSQGKREAELLRIQQSGVILSDLRHPHGRGPGRQRRPDSGSLYTALDMPFAVLVGQISAAHRA